MQSDDIKNLIRRAGLKVTPHRIHVYDMLQASPVALTAEQIYQELKAGINPINMSTVYRIVDSFVEKQLLVRSMMPDDSRTLYEINSHIHRHYLICTGCRRRVEITTCPIHHLEHELADTTGFRIEAHRLELYGKCPACSARQADTGS